MLVVGARRAPPPGVVVEVVEVFGKVAIAPERARRVTLEYFFRMSQHSLSTSVCPFLEAYFELSMTFSVPENGLNSFVKTIHNVLKILLFCNVGLAVGLDQLVGA